jgi:hypothetical protein
MELEPAGGIGGGRINTLPGAHEGDPMLVAVIRASSPARLDLDPETMSTTSAATVQSRWAQ